MTNTKKHKLPAKEARYGPVSVPDIAGCRAQYERSVYFGFGGWHVGDWLLVTDPVSGCKINFPCRPCCTNFLCDENENLMEMGLYVPPIEESAAALIKPYADKLATRVKEWLKGVRITVPT